jgi:hypothetical protein
MSDIEDPVRAILPQLTRTVKATDEFLEVVGGPARRMAPNLVQIADTLGSPQFTNLPMQLSEFMKVMGDFSRRLGPLAQFAESAGGMFGLRLPGSSRSAQPARAPTPLPPSAAPKRKTSSTAGRSTTKKASKSAAAKKR